MKYSRTKLVRVDISKLEETRMMYQNQIKNTDGKKLKRKINDSQVVDIALSHALGHTVDVTIKKRKVIIK